MFYRQIKDIWIFDKQKINYRIYNSSPFYRDFQNCLCNFILYLTGSEDSLETSIQIQYVLYGCSCFFFIVLMCFLYVCKIKVIDSDPSQRHTSARWVRGKQSSFLARCWCKNPAQIKKIEGSYTPNGHKDSINNNCNRGARLCCCCLCSIDATLM